MPEDSAESLEQCAVELQRQLEQDKEKFQQEAQSWELEHKKIDELLQEVETENAELDTRRLALEEKNEEALRELQLQAELQA